MMAIRSQFSDTREMSWVMRIERRAALPPDAVDLRKYLILHDDVEGRRRLVGDDEGWVQRERHGDDGALAHAAAEFMRIAPDPFGLEPDGLE